MAATAVPAADCRIIQLVDHTYRLPTVRELPARIVETADSRTW